MTWGNPVKSISVKVLCEVEINFQKRKCNTETAKMQKLFMSKNTWQQFIADSVAAVLLSKAQ